MWDMIDAALPLIHSNAVVVVSQLLYPLKGVAVVVHKQVVLCCFRVLRSAEIFAVLSHTQFKPQK